MPTAFRSTATSAGTRSCANRRRSCAPRGWVWHSATTPGDLATASSVFDSSTFFTLKDHKGDYTAWYGYGNGIGLVGDTTDGIAWRNRAVTFLENHDTGYRTNEDGTPQEHHEHDNFLNDRQVEQGYAHLLTHPGVHAGSTLYTQDNARARGVYAARVTGRHGDLYVRIGGSDDDWQPYFELSRLPRIRGRDGLEGLGERAGQPAGAAGRAQAGAADPGLS